MKQFLKINTAIFALVILTIISCQKDPEIKTFDDNTAPHYDKIPTLLLENYVNRTFIDLIGREPLDTEMDQEVALMKSTNASTESRLELIKKLQFNTDFIEGDSSYNKAYFHWFYEATKARTIEGASNSEINQELGNANQLLEKILADSIIDEKSLTYANNQIERYTLLLASEDEYRTGSIEIGEVYRRMIYNGIYDRINMNSFNFINAVFDNLLFRFPTKSEFNSSYEMVDKEGTAELFGKTAQEKYGFIQVIVKSREFFQGCIIWAYQLLLARQPSTEELFYHMSYFYETGDFQKLQQEIMITEEYANF